MANLKPLMTFAAGMVLAAVVFSLLNSRDERDNNSKASDDIGGEWSYPQFEATNPSWFTEYGNESILRYTPAGLPQGFWRTYSTTNYREDWADSFATMFSMGLWTTVRSRTTGFDADQDMKAKYDFAHSRLLRIEPDFTSENIDRLHQLPSRLPSP